MSPRKDNGWPDDGRLLMGPVALYDWARGLGGEQKICYCQGLLSRLMETSGEAKKVARVAELAAHDGLIYLTQRRESPGRFSYWATKAKIRMTDRP